MIEGFVFPLFSRFLFGKLNQCYCIESSAAILGFLIYTLVNEVTPVVAGTQKMNLRMKHY